jgi:hypothetical protein
MKKSNPKWFSNRCDDAEEGWDGPHKHIEDALAAIVEDPECECGMPIYVRRGRKMKKAEMEEWGVEFQWQCDGPSIVASQLSPESEAKGD